MHLQLYMFKQRHNNCIVNNINVHTRIHDAILFTTVKPNSEKYKNNALYEGANLILKGAYLILKELLNKKLHSRNCSSTGKRPPR